MYFKIEILYPDETTESFLIDNFFKGKTIFDYIDKHAQFEKVSSVKLKFLEKSKVLGEIILF